MKKTILGIVLFFTVLTQGWGVVLFRSADSNTSKGGHFDDIPLTIKKPAGVVANDVLIASIAFGPDSSTLEIPSGWILLRAISQPSGNGNNLSVFYRVAVSNEPVDYSWIIKKHGDHTIGIAGGIAAFSGVDISHPIDAESGVATPSSLFHSTSITTTVTNTMLVASFEYASSGTWNPQPLDSLMLEAVDVGSENRNSSNGIALEINYGLQVLADTVEKNATASAHEDTGAADIVALRPSIHPPIPPTCNLSNGISLSTYDISAYSNQYTQTDFDMLETNYAIDSLKFGSGTVDNINTTGSNNNPYQNDPDERYLSIFDGYIYIPFPGVYSFAVNGDDAVEVILDSSLLESSLLGSNQSFTFPYAGYYKIKFRHQAWTGGDNYQLYWKNMTDIASIASAYEIVPKSSLFYCSFSKPVVDYRFDECTWNGTAADVKDSSGSGFNATSVNGANTQSSTAAGGGICHVGLFQSANNQYVNAGNVLNPASNDWSVSVWVKWNGGNGEQIIYNKENLYEARVNNGSFQYAWQPHWKWDGGQSMAVPQGVWTHFVIVYDHLSQKVYENGVLRYFRNQTGDIGTNSESLLIGARGSANPSSYFNGNIDELKMFDKAIDATQVLNMYNNEKTQKNYDGTLRTCSDCIFTPVTYKFDAWDTFRKINDRNISTKIVSQEFNLTIASLDENNTQSQDFNGTVCVKIVDENNLSISNWVQTDPPFHPDKNSSSVKFKISKAAKTVIPMIAWKKDSVVDCTNILGNEDNRTLASDFFAIRPAQFFITPMDATVKAGEDFNLSFIAGTSEVNPSLNYNENEGTSFEVTVKERKIPTCINGTFAPNITNDINFTDGKWESTSMKYDEVGIVDINISENNVTCAARYAGVDCDDKNITNSWNTEVNLSISDNNASLTIRPHHFRVEVTSSNYNNGSFTYLATDYNDSMYAKVDVNITAENAANRTTLNYNDSCYAHDVNLSFNYAPVDTNLTRFLYAFTPNTVTPMDGNASINDSISKTLLKSAFTTDNNGSSNFEIRYNFQRDKSKPISPFDINITDFNVIDSANSDVNGTGYISYDGNATFYYGRVKTEDISTNKTSTPHSLQVEVFCATCNGSLNGFHQNSLSWYLMEDDSVTNITKLIPQDNFIYHPDNNKSGLTLEQNSSVPAKSGYVDFNITNNWTQTDSAYIHVNIPKYLWYSRYYEYNATGDCSKHPCFKYNYILDATNVGIGSGDFNGTRIGKDYNATKTKTGVKVFR